MQRRALGVVLAVVLSAFAAAPAQSKQFPPQVARGVTVPVGFAATVFAQTPPHLLPTSLSWAAPAAAASGLSAAALHGTPLYVTTVSGNVAGGTDNGSVLAYEDEGVAPTIVAEGLDQPLGIVVGPDRTLYVSETEANRGRITALRDGNADGTFESKRTVIANLPNGRHQTNGLTFGPDGMLYVANGNATDDGVDCGPPLVPGEGDGACPAPELQPWSGAILRVDPAWTDVDLLADVRMDDDGVRAADGRDDDSVLVARGFRNIYDVDFDPLRATQIWTPMNGPDNPSGSEPVYGLDVADERVADADGTVGPSIEDAGFPSCLYDPHHNDFPMPQVTGGHEHAGEIHPHDNPNPEVIAAFGACPHHGVLLPKALMGEGHEGTSGLTFVRGSQFPARYRDDLLVAEWGSLWNLNGGFVTGHKVMHLELNDEREVVGQREFMSGVLPMDVTFGPDGHLYVADMSGQIYEVAHVSDAATPDDVLVDMSNGQFVPQVVTIVQGQRVRWVNRDATPHNVRAAAKAELADPRSESVVQGGGEINSPDDVPPGGAHAHTFGGETGVYHYTSTTTAADASAMRGTIIVLPVHR